MPVRDQIVLLPIAGAPTERRDAAANRARILEVGRRLLEEEGFDAVSVDRIAAEAGVGKGTVFRRFGDRAGLTAALLDDQVRELQDAFLSGPPPLGPGAPAAARLEAFLDAYLEWMNRDLDLALAAELAAPTTVSAIAGSLILHIRGLVKELDPDADDLGVATILLGSVAPIVVAHLRDRGIELTAQQASVRSILRGLTRA